MQAIDKAHLRAWFELPFFELLHRAHDTHRRHFPGHRIQRSALLSIKTGGCSEDCGYCAQSARHHAHSREPLLDTQTIVRHATAAKEAGATRFCMGAAWRAPKVELAERLRALTEGQLGHAFFASDGASATEIALNSAWTAI
ncbi:MAG: hypothetical protein HZA65_00440 [Rhodocyclales bacterium]|nr:hypothetical protein [Rhodocyclales bacterium]